jgi:hypothetical protein
VSIRPAQWGKADYQIASRISIRHGIYIDRVQQIRPGGDAFNTCNHGLLKSKINVHQIED